MILEMVEEYESCYRTVFRSKHEKVICTDGTRKLADFFSYSIMSPERSSLLSYSSMPSHEIKIICIVISSNYRVIVRLIKLKLFLFRTCQKGMRYCHLKIYYEQKRPHILGHSTPMLIRRFTLIASSHVRHMHITRHIDNFQSRVVTLISSRWVSYRQLEKSSAKKKKTRTRKNHISQPLL
ncbi:hypothetical protein RND81_11G200900 [Saponaria officinalis]|uniref:Uncharacterized protein n=1 Tax=Saponaria officinalis TaxID=3572 RepID=A0AAW1HPD6_SAPOF